MTVRDDILAYFQAHPGVVAYSHLSAFGRPNYIGVYLGLLVKEGLIQRRGRGLYQLSKPSRDNNQSVQELTFGFEIEAEYNDSVLKIQPASYHDAVEKKMVKNWKIERDGSLYTTRWNGTVEFISVPTTFSKIDKLLESFETTIKKKTGKNKLHEVLNFNSSTGAHVHIGLQNDGRAINIKDFVQRDFLKKISRKFKQRIKTEMPEFYENFKKDYFRKYARRQTRNNENSRYQEFNYQTRIPTIEYRSPHLRGITTWTDFSKFYTILTKTVNEIFQQEISEKENPFLTEVTTEFETRNDEQKEVVIELKQKMKLKDETLVV